MSVVGSPVEQLAGEFRETGLRFRLEEPLARYTTLGIGGPAELLVYPASTEELSAAMTLAEGIGLSVKVLGGGSNLIVSDEGVRGVVIHTGAMEIVRFLEGGKIEAEAGVNFPRLARAAVSRGLRGLEVGVGIPGSLGGVVVMNAGAYGFSIGDRVESVTVVAPGKGRLDLSRDQVGFSYRSSSLGAEVVVTRSTLRLVEDDPAAIRADMEKHMAHRKTTQPVGVKSAGCIFKNPPGDSAGRIIDELGLKGLRVGGAWVSDVHANFIVHEGEATAADVAALIDEIRERVHRTASIVLEEEVKRWP